MVLVLTAVWIILRENFSAITLAIGFVVSLCCVWFFYRFFPALKTENLSLIRLFVYFLYLIPHIYIGGIGVIGIILSGAQVEIVEIKTQLQSRFLRTLLVNSITLAPGSVALDLREEGITLLWLMKKSENPPETDKIEELLKGRLERMLLKIQK